MNKEFFKKYKHGVPMIVCMIIYLVWFFILENREVHNYNIIYMAIDDKIPFIEIFVIPYFCWFAYISVFVVYFMFTNKEDYSKLFTFLVTGMALFLVISTVWPNGHELRPEIFPRDNIFTRMIAGIYKVDTSTNIVPSIHVYNSIGVQLAVMKSEKLRKYKIMQIVSAVLCISIILSTVFIKQHSLFDVIVAFALAAVMYQIVYVKEHVFSGIKKKAVSDEVIL